MEYSALRRMASASLFLAMIAITVYILTSQMNRTDVEESMVRDAGIERAKESGLRDKGPRRSEIGTPTPNEPAISSGATAGAKLDREPTLEVLVLDPDASVLEGVEVRASRKEKKRHEHITVTTDASGVAYFWMEGDLTLRVEAKGFEVLSREVTVSREERSRINVTLERGLRIYGRVEDETGAAVSDCIVECRDVSGIRSVLSDTDGHYEMGGFSAGLVSVRAEGPKGGGRDERTVELEAEECRVDLQLRFSPALEVRVQNASFEGLPGIEVSLFLHTMDQRALVVASRTADASGRILFSRCLPGTYHIVAKDSVIGRFFPRATTVVTSDVDQVVVIVLERRASVVAVGQIIYDDGEPVRDAQVCASIFVTAARGGGARDLKRSSAMTDANGGFSLEGLSASQYSLKATISGGSEVCLGIHDLSTSRNLPPFFVERDGQLVLTSDYKGNYYVYPVVSPQSSQILSAPVAELRLIRPLLQAAVRLRPGWYVAMDEPVGVVMQREIFEIQASSETHVFMRKSDGHSATLEFFAESAYDLALELGVEVVDRSGAVVFDESLRRSRAEDPFLLNAVLRDGEYEVNARDRNRTWTRRIHVEKGYPKPDQILLEATQ